MDVLTDPISMGFLFFVYSVLGLLFLLMWWQGRKGP